MQRTLRQHFLFLEERIQNLRNQLTNPCRTGAELAQTRSEIQNAEYALEHYRAALDLELKLQPLRDAKTRPGSSRRT